MDAQGLVELAACLEDVGDLAHGDGSGVHVVQALVDGKHVMRQNGQCLVQRTGEPEDVGLFSCGLGGMCRISTRSEQVRGLQSGRCTLAPLAQLSMCAGGFQQQVGRQSFIRVRQLRLSGEKGIDFGQPLRQRGGVCAEAQSFGRIGQRGHSIWLHHQGGEVQHRLTPVPQVRCLVRGGVHIGL